jgi:hypothetical protein
MRRLALAITKIIRSFNKPVRTAWLGGHQRRADLHQIPKLRRAPVSGKHFSNNPNFNK